MQVTNTNFRETHKLSYENTKKTQDEANFAKILEQEQKKQIKFEDIDNMTEISEFVWNECLNATTDEEREKYQDMMLTLFTVKFGVAMGEAMKKQGITCPQDMDIELFKQAKQEVNSNEERFKDYLLSGIDLLERGAIKYSSDGTRPPTPTEFKANIEGTKDLLKSILKNL